MVNDKLIELALSQYGITEWAGDEHNPEVLKYFDETGNAWVDDDETAWCSAYVNWVAKMAGYEWTSKLNARSWLDIGDTIRYNMRGLEVTEQDYDEFYKDIELGDIVIFWRIKEDSPYGHVGFYIADDEHYYYVLGGNQNNKVQISKYPKSRLLGIRRLRKQEEIVSYNKK